MYMVGIKYVNLIEIGLAIIEIQAVENGKLLVPVNNTHVHYTAFLASDTWPCVLILGLFWSVKKSVGIFTCQSLLLGTNLPNDSYLISYDFKWAVHWYCFDAKPFCLTACFITKRDTKCYDYALKMVG